MLMLADINTTQQQAFEFARMPHGWRGFFYLMMLVSICVLIVWFYRREARVGASAPLRVSLAVVRCLVVVLLAGVWLQPVIATYIVRTVSARVAVLVDASASMTIPDAELAGSYTGRPPSRLDAVNALLNKEDHSWLHRLEARNELVVVAFGEDAQAVPLPWSKSASSQPGPEPDAPASSSASPSPAGASPSIGGAPRLLNMPVAAALQNRTDLGAAVTQAIDHAAGSPIAGVIVLSDGAINKGMAAEEIAAYAARFQARIYAVGVGGTKEPPNVRIVSLSAPAATPKDDPFEIRVEAAAAGIEPTPVQLELVSRRVDGPGRGSSATGETSLGTRELTLGGERSSAVELFRVQPTQGGEFIYEARITRLPGEPVTSDNERQTVVRVLEDHLRVLIVAGRPSYDYRFITALLERDRSIDVSCWLQSADAQAVRDGDPGAVITELPRRTEELFNYDAVLLLDPNPAEFDSAWALAVRRLVDEFSGGLLLEAGPHFTSRFLRDTRLSDLVATLPILHDPDADVRLSEEGTYRTQATSLEIPPDAAASPLLQFSADDALNRQIWHALPGVWWYLPVLREKPLATVLLRAGVSPDRPRAAPQALFAVQPFGAGRVAYLGFENTWRWRATAEPHFNRFWVQLVRYLAQARREGAGKRGMIVVDRDLVNLGDYLKLEVRVLDDAFAPWPEPQVNADIEFPDGEHRPAALYAIPGRDGWFAGRMVCEREGQVVIRLTLPGVGAKAGAAASETALTKYIRVYRPEVELRTLKLSGETLAKLAERTNGQYLALADADKLPELIDRATEVTSTRGRNRDLWDNGGVLLGLTLLLGVEWFLRRRNQLL